MTINSTPVSTALRDRPVDGCAGMGSNPCRSAGKRDIHKRGPTLGQQVGGNRRRGQTRDGIGNGIAHEHRRLAGHHQSPGGGRVVTEGDPVAVGSTTSVAGDRHPCRACGHHVIDADPPLLHNPGPARLEYQVCTGDQLPQLADGSGGGQVKARPLLASVQQLEEPGGSTPGPVGTGPRLHFEHPAPGLSQQPACQRARPKAGEVHHRRRPAPPGPGRSLRSQRPRLKRRSGGADGSHCEAEFRPLLHHLGRRHGSDPPLDLAPVTDGHRRAH